MNIVYRKLAMIERDLIAREEAARIDGSITCPINHDLKNKITKLLDQVR